MVIRPSGVALLRQKLEQPHSPDRQTYDASLEGTVGLLNVSVRRAMGLKAPREVCRKRVGIGHG